MLQTLDFLRKKDFDCISFLPNIKKEELKIEGGNYINKGEEIKGTLGCMYHINLFQVQEDNKISEVDTFEAVLSDPIIYLSHIIPSGFFGFISKKTTTSDEFNNDALINLKEAYN